MNRRTTPALNGLFRTCTRTHAHATDFAQGVRRMSAAFFALAFFALPAFAATGAAASSAPEQAPAASDSAAEKTASVHTYSLFLTAGPNVLVNTASSTSSAPSPIMFSCGFGATLFTNKPVQFEPRLSFFTNYYLWNNARALPAEVENRTATVLSFMFDLPAAYTWKYNAHSFEAGAGLGFLARVGILSNGVSGSDKNRDDSSRTASEDVSDINSYFWSGARFLYPEIFGVWTYDIRSGWKAGLETRLYFPLGSFIAGSGMDAAIISASARLVLPL
jgi:hypothetical protein